MCTCVVPMGGRQHGNKLKWSRVNAIRPLLAIQVCLKSDLGTLRTGARNVRRAFLRFSEQPGQARFARGLAG
jgi:hypothetical protein